MEKSVVGFIVSVYKKTELLSENDFLEAGIVPKARSKALKTVQDGLETIVIGQGAMTTHAGIFAIIYQENNPGKAWAVIAYRPTFNYDVYTDLKSMNDYLAINAPGMRL